MYNYETQKQELLTDNGLDMYVKIRDRANKLLNDAGAFMMGNVISVASGDNWTMIACVDRMVEAGEIVEVTKQGTVAGQHRVFTRK